MSDEAARNTPDGDRPDSGDWGVEPPADLDTALAQAADLADSLSDQVGGKDPRSPDDTLVSDAPQIDVAAAGVDEQLNEIEHMIGEVRSEVGAEAGAPVESLAVAGAATSSSPAGRSSATAPMPVASSTDAASPQAARTAAGGGSGTTVPGSAADDATAVQPDAQKSPRGPGGLRRMIGAGVNVGYGALDVIDRPFGFVGPRVRGILGWVAIALFAASVIVLVVTRQ